MSGGGSGVADASDVEGVEWVLSEEHSERENELGDEWVLCEEHSVRESSGGDVKSLGGKHSENESSGGDAKSLCGEHSESFEWRWRCKVQKAVHIICTFTKTYCNN